MRARHADYNELKRVSMKSGLGDRNNAPAPPTSLSPTIGLNEVRSWRPEQYPCFFGRSETAVGVSMKSGLGDRNNSGTWPRSGSMRSGSQ